MPATSLRRAVGRLEKHYGAPSRPFPTDPFQQILWVNVAYLADDNRRAAAFKELKRGTGLTPQGILHAPIAALRAATGRGILPERFVEKLREAARIALDEFDGDLDAVTKLPLPEARRALRRFPGIGEPGAEQILLFSGHQPLLAPDSNALRVLRRLGITPGRKSYSAEYAVAREVSSAELGTDTQLMQRAHQLLRRHGQELCKVTAPACDQCPLESTCPRIGVLS